MQFLGVAGEAEIQDFQPFIDRTGTGGFPQVADVSGELWSAFGTGGRSTFLFINDDGSTELTTYGAIRGDDLKQRVEALIAN